MNFFEKKITSVGFNMAKNISNFELLSLSEKLYLS